MNNLGLDVDVQGSLPHNAEKDPTSPTNTIAATLQASPTRSNPHYK
jgi:hypothetical protein